MYRIPAQLNLTVTIDGRGLRVADTEYLSMIGPGRDAAIDNLRVRPGDVSSFEVSGAVGRFAYRSAPGQTESPLFHIGLVGDGKGYRIGVKELSLAAGSLITSQNDRARGTLTFQDTGTQSGTFEVTLVHYAQGKVRKLRDAPDPARCQPEGRRRLRQHPTRPDDDPDHDLVAWTSRPRGRPRSRVASKRLAFVVWRPQDPLTADLGV